ncbi:MAG TPA: aminotransferase class I/II-fold pyridoxal phosphate-dependent enzyme [Chitinophagaceae bacterium]|nr:aminotransferase class I/II-fold pyridoxal phosphate-dependent enzyme [Chitinophagaceae bacterium]
MPTTNRRNFLKASGLVLIPGFLPSLHTLAAETDKKYLPPAEPVVKFFYDGEGFDGAAYWEQLQQANSKKPIKVDRYGNGGVVDDLQKKFEAITGKEKAIYMPTGTMANQLAIAVLSGENSKVFVQDTSHVYRDEADAAQSIFNKRLMPLAKDETYFTADTLKKAIENLDHEEVFKSGIGCVSVECPVRRTNGCIVPIDEIKKISEYCRSNNIKLHLDGARIYMASAWSGVSVKEYASYFDTIYISLYKYLGASGGAILCGDKSVMDKMPHLVKIHGGNMFGNWLSAAMALHRLDGLEERLQEAKKRSAEIFASLNELAGIKINALDGGTNIYNMHIPSSITVQKFGEHLGNKYSIAIPRPDKNGDMKITVNETLLYRDTKYIVDAFKDAIKIAGG